jgi:hypothetical protein
MHQIRDKETTWDDECNYDLEEPNLKRTWNNMKKESGLYDHGSPVKTSSQPTSNKRRSRR